MSAIDWIKESLSKNARVTWLSSPEEQHQTCLIPFDVFAALGKHLLKKLNVTENGYFLNVSPTLRIREDADSTLET